MNTARGCRGLSGRAIGRRAFLETTVAAGGAGLTLPMLLQSRAAARESGQAAREPGQTVRDTAVIQIWLGGGPTHFETYDPKPQAPAEYRGPFGAISTCLPGVQICETLPRHAQILDKVAILRSVYHNSADHDAGMYFCTTGKKTKFQPSTGSYTARIRGANQPGLPAYVHLGFQPTTNLVFVPNFKAEYLGGGYDPFYITDDPAEASFQVPNLRLADGVTIDRLGDRRSLLGHFDRLRRQADRSGAMGSMDQFGRAAFDMVTGAAAREAFDLSREDPKTRERYGMHRWGQSCLLARRLVESGVTFVTVNFDPHSFSFDMHANVERGMRSAGPRMDSAIPALVEDLHERGLADRVMVIAWGEFGRTPRVNPAGGRDHWGEVMSVLVAGGGLRVGQVIGSSTPKGEVPKDRPIIPYDVLATMYRHLGIDPYTTFTDHAGRPTPLLNEGTVIGELV
ncbi:MAG: DUF1501 domain-containing protein [Planctomycetia bacterium]|nr:DUF1501 domain-containing protein [Planctomycetia bacterium]